MVFDEYEDCDCITCSIRFRVPKGFEAHRRRDGRAFWCPNGHQMVYRETEADTLRRERDRLKQNAAYLENRIAELANQRDMAERRVSAAKGQVTKLKNRARAGLCPCCNRSFVKLAQHMATKHPGFIQEPTADEHVH